MWKTHITPYLLYNYAFKNLLTIFSVLQCFTQLYTYTQHINIKFNILH